MKVKYTDGDDRVWIRITAREKQPHDIYAASWAQETGEGQCRVTTTNVPNVGVNVFSLQE